LPLCEASHNGKTHLAIVLAVKACAHGFKVLCTTMNSLVARLKESQARVKPYVTASLVVVDEVGYLPVNANEAYLFFQFVSSRYEKASTIITLNKSFIDWQELFGGQIIASAILDRLLHHCRVVNIKGHSYKLKGKAFAQQLIQNHGGTAHDLYALGVECQNIVDTFLCQNIVDSFLLSQFVIKLTYLFHIQK